MNLIVSPPVNPLQLADVLCTLTGWHVPSVGVRVRPATARSRDRLRERPRQRRLAGTGHILQQEVPLAEQRRHRQPDDVGLAQQHPFDVGDDGVDGALEPGRLVVGERVERLRRGRRRVGHDAGALLVRARHGLNVLV